MSTYSLKEIEQMFVDAHINDKIRNAHAYSVILSNCILSKDYSTPDDIGNSIHLTPCGEIWYNDVITNITGISPAEAKLSVFVRFAYDELYVDTEKTNLESIRSFIDMNILNGRMRFPWIYCADLYEKFHLLSFDLKNTLDQSETEMLLENSPFGVFQVRNYILGPFGILESKVIRYLNPKVDVPLWHCDEPACKALHSVNLKTKETKILDASGFIISETRNRNIEESDWSEFLYNKERRTEFFSDLNVENLPWLLANAFSTQEHRSILIEMLNRYSKEIRSEFPKHSKFKSVLTGSNEAICSKLQKDQLLQLILLRSNEDIAEVVEYLIEKDKIEIPWTEIRTSKYGPGEFGIFNNDLQCSKHGIRSVSKISGHSVKRLINLITSIYRFSEEKRQIDWILRHEPGESIGEKVSNYVHSKDPFTIIKEIVYSSPSCLAETIKYLRFGNFPNGISANMEEYYTKKILWKLGFSLNSHPSHNSLFWMRLDQLLASCRTYSVYSEVDRESIRGSAVNLFVSVEELLDMSASFIGWVLLSDHYWDTNYIWNIEKGRYTTYSIINNIKNGSQEPIQYDVNGKNTLYPLVKSFGLIADVCKELIDTGEDKYIRENEKLHLFYKCHNDVKFPFSHTRYLFDISKHEQTNVLEKLKGITKDLEICDLCNIRNRLEHKRNDFPSQEEIESLCMNLTKVMDLLEKTGICPLVYFKESESKDAYGRRVIQLSDYKKRKISVHQPSDFHFTELPIIIDKMIIVPSIHVGGSIEQIRFKNQESSEYVSMWKNYPRRRSISSENPLEVDVLETT